MDGCVTQHVCVCVCVCVCACAGVGVWVCVVDWVHQRLNDTSHEAWQGPYSHYCCFIVFQTRKGITKVNLEEFAKNVSDLADKFKKTGDKLPPGANQTRAYVSITYLIQLLSIMHRPIAAPFTFWRPITSRQNWPDKTTTRGINTNIWRRLFTWFWRWLPLRKSKRQSPATTVFLKTTLTRTNDHTRRRIILIVRYTLFHVVLTRTGSGWRELVCDLVYAMPDSLKTVVIQCQLWFFMILIPSFLFPGIGKQNRGDSCWLT